MEVWGKGREVSWKALLKRHHLTGDDGYKLAKRRWWDFRQRIWLIGRPRDVRCYVQSRYSVLLNRSLLY